MILAWQSINVLPALNSNVQKILNGEIVPKNTFHYIFIILEITKLLLLFIAGVVIIKQLVDEKRY
jgi:hypothetical protein